MDSPEATPSPFSTPASPSGATALDSKSICWTNGTEVMKAECCLQDGIAHFQFKTPVGRMSQVDVIDWGVLRGCTVHASSDGFRMAASTLLPRFPEAGGVYVVLLCAPGSKDWIPVSVGSGSSVRACVEALINDDGSFGPQDEVEQYWLYPTAQARGFSIRVMFGTGGNPQAAEAELLAAYDFCNNDDGNGGDGTPGCVSGQGYRLASLPDGRTITDFPMLSGFFYRDLCRKGLAAQMAIVLRNPASAQPGVLDPVLATLGLGPHPSEAEVGAAVAAASEQQLQGLQEEVTALRKRGFTPLGGALVGQRAGSGEGTDPDASACPTDSAYSSPHQTLKKPVSRSPDDPEDWEAEWDAEVAARLQSKRGVSQQGYRRARAVSVLCPQVASGPQGLQRALSGAEREIARMGGERERVQQLERALQDAASKQKALEAELQALRAQSAAGGPASDGSGGSRGRNGRRMAERGQGAEQPKQRLMGRSSGANAVGTLQLSSQRSQPPPSALHSGSMAKLLQQHLQQQVSSSLTSEAMLLKHLTDPGLDAEDRFGGWPDDAAYLSQAPPAVQALAAAGSPVASRLGSRLGSLQLQSPGQAGSDGGALALLAPPWGAPAVGSPSGPSGPTQGQAPEAYRRWERRKSAPGIRPALHSPTSHLAPNRASTEWFGSKGSAYALAGGASPPGAPLLLPSPTPHLALPWHLSPSVTSSAFNPLFQSEQQGVFDALPMPGTPRGASPHLGAQALRAQQPKQAWWRALMCASPRAHV